MSKEVKTKIVQDIECSKPQSSEMEANPRSEPPGSNSMVWVKQEGLGLLTGNAFVFCSWFDVLAAAWGLGRPAVGQGYGWHTLQVLSKHFQAVGLRPLVGHKINYWIAKGFCYFHDIMQYDRINRTKQNKVHCTW